jgi:hypothetical protein
LGLKDHYAKVPTLITLAGYMVPIVEGGVFPETTLNKMVQVCRVRASPPASPSHTIGAWGEVGAFEVFYCYDEAVMRNTSLANFNARICWRGEVLIMKTGCGGQYVNMKEAADKKMACFVLQEYFIF